MAKTMPLRTQAENEVLKEARRYARMKLHGVYIDSSGRGAVATVCGSDVKDLTELYKGNLLRAAERLLLAMAVDEADEQLQE